MFNYQRVYSHIVNMKISILQPFLVYNVLNTAIINQYHISRLCWLWYTINAISIINTISIYFARFYDSEILSTSESIPFNTIHHSIAYHQIYPDSISTSPCVFWSPGALHLTQGIFLRGGFFWTKWWEDMPIYIIYIVNLYNSDIQTILLWWIWCVYKFSNSLYLYGLNSL